MNFKKYFIVFSLILLSVQAVQAVPEKVLWDNTKTVSSHGIDITAPMEFTTCDISPDGIGDGWDNCIAYVRIADKNLNHFRDEYNFDTFWAKGNVRNVVFEYTKDVSSLITPPPKIQKKKSDKKNQDADNSIFKISNGTDLDVDKSDNTDTSPIYTAYNFKKDIPDVQRGEILLIKISFQKKRWTADSFILSGKIGNVPHELDPDITGCGAIGASGTYTLQNDLNFSSGNCIAINAANVIFDGNGHTITGNVTANVAIVASGANGIIKNAILNRTSSSAYGVAQLTGAGTTFNNNTINTNGTALLITGNNIIVSNSLINSTSTGIVLQGAILNPTITNNVINVSTAGISETLGDPGVTGGNISFNSIHTKNGILMQLFRQNSSTIANNTMYSDINEGILLFRSFFNTFTDNWIQANKSIYSFVQFDDGTAANVSSYNNFTNNTFNGTDNGGLSGILIWGGASYNNFTNGSVYVNTKGAGSADYWIYNGIGYLANRFLNTNFSSWRLIGLSGKNSFFSYSNQSGTGYISVNSSVAGDTIINRSIVNWTLHNINVSDKPDSNITSTYLLHDMVHNGTFNVKVNGTSQYNVTVDATGYGKTNPISLKKTQANFIEFDFINNFSFTFSNPTLSDWQIYQSSQPTLIKVTITDIDGSISSASVGLTLSGIERNYTMTQAGNTWSYSFQSGAPGIYTVNFYATDNDGGTNRWLWGQFVEVVPVVGGGSSGGGGAGSSVPPGAINNVSDLINAVPLNIKTLAKDETGNKLLNGFLGFGAFLIVIGSGKKTSNGTFLWGIVILFAAAYSLGYLE